MVFGLRHTGTDKGLSCQVLVTAGVVGRQLGAGQRISRLGLGRCNRTTAAGQGGIQGLHTGIHVHGVHLRQQLPGFHGVTHIDPHSQHSTRCRRSHRVAVSGLNHTNAKQRGRHHPHLRRYDSHLHWCQGSRGSQQIHHAANEHNARHSQENHFKGWSLKFHRGGAIARKKSLKTPGPLTAI